MTYPELRLPTLPRVGPYVPAWTTAFFAALREKDKVFERVEEAYDDRSIAPRALKSNLRPAGSDPRFQDLLRRMNLQP